MLCVVMQPGLLFIRMDARITCFRVPFFFDLKYL